MMNSQPVRSSNPALNVLKNVGASTLFLVATILLSANTVISVISSVFVSRSLGNTAYLFSVLSKLGLDYDDVMPYLDSVGRSSSASGLVGAIVGAVPMILICVGMWLTWATCRNMNSGNVSTTGLTMCRVIIILYRVAAIIGLVGCVIGGVALLILGVSFSSSYSGYSDYGYSYGYGMGGAFAGPMFLGIGIAVLIVGTALMVLLLCFYISAGRAVTRIRETAMTGVPDSRISMFLIVMLWIVAIIGALNSLSFLFISPLVGVSALVGAAGQILLALCLKKYRDEMAKLMPVSSPYGTQGYQQPYVQQPVYGQPQQQAQPYQQPYQAPYQQPVQAPQQPYGQQVYGQPQQQAQPYQQPYQAPYQQPVQAPQQPHQPEAPQQVQDPTQQG